MKRLSKGFSYFPFVIVISALLTGGAFLFFKEDVFTTTPLKKMAMCSNQTLFLEVKYDKDIWTCEPVDNGIERSYIDFSSETIEIRVGDLPRGFYCGEGFDLEGGAVCSTEDYPLRDNIFVSEYKIDDVTGEIFGGVNIGSGSFISITWTEMEIRDLTEKEKKELLDLLYGISSIGNCTWPCQ